MSSASLRWPSSCHCQWLAAWCWTLLQVRLSISHKYVLRDWLYCGLITWTDSVHTGCLPQFTAVNQRCGCLVPKWLFSVQKVICQAINSSIWIMHGCTWSTWSWCEPTDRLLTGLLFLFVHYKNIMRTRRTHSYFIATKYSVTLMLNCFQQILFFSVILCMHFMLCCNISLNCLALLNCQKYAS